MGEEMEEIKGHGLHPNLIKSLTDPPLRQKSIISTPKIDFRADFRPTSAGKSACFDLLKIRRPLRHPTKTAQKKGLV